MTTRATTYGTGVRKWFWLFTNEEVFVPTEHFINTCTNRHASNCIHYDNLLLNYKVIIWSNAFRNINISANSYVQLFNSTATNSLQNIKMFFKSALRLTFSKFKPNKHFCKKIFAKNAVYLCHWTLLFSVDSSWSSLRGSRHLALSPSCSQQAWPQATNGCHAIT